MLLTAFFTPLSPSRAITDALKGGVTIDAEQFNSHWVYAFCYLRFALQ